MALNKIHAFTEKRTRIEDRLINKVVIKVEDKQIEADALWDTGATCTADYISSTTLLNNISKSHGKGKGK